MMEIEKNALYNVHIEEDVHFATAADPYGKETDLLMDVYMPVECKRAQRPLLFLVHGGGFYPENDKRQSYVVKFARWFASRGFVVVSPEYTRYNRDSKRPDYGTCAVRAAEECDLARRYMLHNAEEFRIDPDCMLLGGGSAGGMTCNMWCTQHPHTFRAFLNFWGSVENSPAAEKYPPTFIVHGTEDPLVPYRFSTALKEKLDAAGVRCKLFTVEHAGHTPVGVSDTYLPEILDFLADC